MTNCKSKLTSLIVKPYILITSAGEGLGPVYMEKKLSRGRRVTRLPELPWASQLFLHFLTKLGEPFLHEKQKVGSAGRVTRLAGSPFFDGKVTLLAGPTFLHINTLARLAGQTSSTRDNQLARGKGSTFFSYKRSLKLARLGG